LEVLVVNFQLPPRRSSRAFQPDNSGLAGNETKKEKKKKRKEKKKKRKKMLTSE